MRRWLDTITREDRARAGWTAALLLLVFGFWAWAGLNPERWARWGVVQMDGWFDDWTAILAAGEAWAEGANPWAIPNLHDPYGRPHVYGPGWLAIGELGIRVTDTLWTGALVVAVFVVVAARAFDARDWRGGLFAGLVLLSAPVLLGVARANNDLVIFAMVAGSAWCAGRREGLAQWLAVIGVVAAALLKFYPVVALIAAGALSGPPLDRLRRVAASIMAGAALAVWHREEIGLSLAAVPTERSWWAYDAAAACEMLWANAVGGGVPGMWLGALLALCLVLVVFRVSSVAWWRFLEPRGRRTFWIVASGTIWMGCLLSGPSYGYRAIWLLPLFGSFLRDQAAPRSARVATGLLALGFFAMTTLKHITILRYFDEGRREESSRLVFAMGAEQLLLLATMAAYGVVLAGWAWRLCEIWWSSRSGATLAKPDKP